MRVLIVEGPDGAGKTSLIQRLATEFALNDGRSPLIEHHGPYLGEENIGWHYFRSMKRAIGPAQQRVIMDRSWLSEPIYAEHYRATESRIKPAELQQLERAGLTGGAVVIRCDPGWGQCRLNWAARKGEEYVKTVDKMEAIYDRYLSLNTAHPFPQITWDYVSSTLASITDWLKMEPTRAAPPGYAGNAKDPKAVIVADTANHVSFTLPFFSFLRTGCSWWLAETMAEAGIRERDLLWTNAYDIDGTPRNPTRIKELNKPTFALGKNALKWCGKNGIDCIEHKHPMYWKRFQFLHTYPLITDLKEVMK